MGMPVHPLANLELAGKHLNTLPASDISKRYFAGTAKYNSTFLNRIVMYFTINSTLKTLNSFYPYEPIIKVSNQQYDNEMSCSITTGMFITAASWFTIFNLARKGKVLPILNQYGKYFKTHRIFRQYVYTLLAPTALLTGLLNWKYLNHTQHLWATHARRMNQQVTKDPSQTEYPKELAGPSWIGSWQTTFFELPDIQRKRLNETNILLAPNYTQIEYEIVQKQKAQSDDEQAEQSD